MLAQGDFNIFWPIDHGRHAAPRWQADPNSGYGRKFSPLHNGIGELRGANHDCVYLILRDGPVFEQCIKCSRDAADNI